MHLVAQSKRVFIINKEPETTKMLKILLVLKCMCHSVAPDGENSVSQSIKEKMMSQLCVTAGNEMHFVRKCVVFMVKS